MSEEDFVSVLVELAELHRCRALSDVEYSFVKARVLGADVDVPRPAARPVPAPTAVIPAGPPHVLAVPPAAPVSVSRPGEGGGLSGVMTAFLGASFALAFLFTTPLLEDPQIGPVTAPELAIRGTGDGWPLVLLVGPALAACVVVATVRHMLQRRPAPAVLVIAALTIVLPGTALLALLRTTAGAVAVYAAGVAPSSVVGAGFWMVLGCCLLTATGALLAGRRSGHRMRWFAFVGAPALMIAVGASAVGLALAQDEAQRELVPLLALDPGPGPVAVGFVSGSQGGGVIRAPDGGSRQILGSQEQLYGGISGGSNCRRDELTAALAGAGAERTLPWAAALTAGGSPSSLLPADVSRYVAGLTPVLLRHDTRVTEFQVVGTRMLPFQALLQAGTAVLVDAAGMPRVRCASGSPLLPPRAIDGEPSYTGPVWSGFGPSEGVTIVPAQETIHEFGLLDSAGSAFRRPAGTDGAQDIDQVPEEALIDGVYELWGEQASCNLEDCDPAAGYPLTVLVDGCLTECRITALDGEWNGPVAMNRRDDTWWASGTVAEQASFSCAGPEPTSFVLQLRVRSGTVVEQAWMADQVTANFAKTSSSRGACLAGYLSWDMAGSRR
jgi:hypothetical protein